VIIPSFDLTFVILPIRVEIKIVVYPSLPTALRGANDNLDFKSEGQNHKVVKCGGKITIARSG
jgi:hypothetical protein